MSTRVFISSIRTKESLEQVKSDMFAIAQEFGGLVGIFFNRTTHGWVDFEKREDAEIFADKINAGVIFYKDRKLKAKFASTRKIHVPKVAFSQEQVDGVWNMIVDFDLFNTAKEFNTKGMLPSSGSSHLQRAIAAKKNRMAEYLIKKVKKISADDVTAAIKIKNFKLIAAMYGKGARCDDAGYNLAKEMNMTDAIFLFDKKRQQ